MRTKVKTSLFLFFILSLPLFCYSNASDDITCDVTWTTTNSSMTISGLDAPHVIMKLFTPNWLIETECFDNCPTGLMVINGLLSGETYHLSYNLYDNNWNPICEDLVDVFLSGTSNNLPDLNASNLISNDGEAGDVKSFSFDLNNWGSAIAHDDYLINTYLSVDNIWSSDDTFVGDILTGETPIGSIEGINGAITVPNLPIGNYYLILVVDDGNAIAESNELNNVIAAPFEILGSDLSSCGFLKEGILVYEGYALGNCMATETAIGYTYNCNTSDDEKYQINIDRTGDLVSNSLDALNAYRITVQDIRGTTDLVVSNTLLGPNTSRWTKTVHLDLGPGYGSTLSIVSGSGVEVYDGYFIVGTVAAQNTAGQNKFLQYSIKLDNARNVVYARILGENAIDGDFVFQISGKFIERSNELIEESYTTSGGYLVGAYQQNELSFMKFSEAGDFLWKTLFASDLPSNRFGEIEISPDEQFIYAVNRNNQRAYVDKVNTVTGDRVYKLQVSSQLDLDYNFPPNGELIKGILLTADGGFITGMYNISSGKFIYGKLDANGVRVWQKNIDSEYTYEPLLKTSDGGVLFFGTKPMSGDRSLGVLKISANGDITPTCQDLEDRADLVLSNFSIEDNMGSENEQLTFTFDLNNLGTAVATGDYKVNLYLSNDDTWSSDDVVIGFVDTGNTPIGTIPNVTSNFTVPAQPIGNYSLILVVDAENNIVESVENNNEIVLDFEIIVDTDDMVCGFIHEDIFHSDLRAVACYGQEDIDVYRYQCNLVQDTFLQLTIDKSGNLQHTLYRRTGSPDEIKTKMNAVKDIVVTSGNDASEYWSTPVTFSLLPDYIISGLVIGTGVYVYDGVLVAGTFAATKVSDGSNHFFHYSIKLDADGVLIDSHIYDNSVIDGDFHFRISELYTSSEGYIVQTRQQNLLSLMKFSEDGSFLWKTAFASDLPSNRFGEIDIDFFEDYIYAVNRNNQRAYIQKMDARTGAVVYKLQVSDELDLDHEFNGQGGDLIKGVHLTSDGGLITGILNFDSGKYIYGKLDSNGHRVWQRNFDSEYIYEPLIGTNDNGFLFMGTKRSGPGTDYAVMKVNEDGSLDCIDVPSDGTPIACEIAYEYSGTDLTLTGNGLNSDHVIIDVYDVNWTPIYSCFDNCGEFIVIQSLSPGTYHVKTKLYDGPNGAWIQTCDETTQIVIGDSGQRDFELLEPTNLSEEFEVSIFPNPTSNDFSLKLSGVEGQKGAVFIFNSMGQEIQHITIDQISVSPILMNRSNLESGIYQVVVKVDGLLTKVQKLVVVE